MGFVKIVISEGRKAQEWEGEKNYPTSTKTKTGQQVLCCFCVQCRSSEFPSGCLLKNFADLESLKIKIHFSKFLTRVKPCMSERFYRNFCFCFADEDSNISRMTEKIANEEVEYVKILNSASELYDNAVAKTNDDQGWDMAVIFKSLNCLAAGCNNLINDVSVMHILLPIYLMRHWFLYSKNSI